MFAAVIEFFCGSVFVSFLSASHDYLRLFPERKLITGSRLIQLSINLLKARIYLL